MFIMMIFQFELIQTPEKLRFVLQKLLLQIQVGKLKLFQFQIERMMLPVHLFDQYPESPG